MFRSLLAVSLCTFLPAQRTWIVDAAGGAGVHFLDIPPAVSAAADGDTLLVRAATTSYQTTVLTKALSIVGSGTPRLASNGAFFLIRGIAANKAASLSGFDFDTGVGVMVQDCAGPVILSQLNAPRWSGYAIGLRVSDSDAVSVVNCELRASGPSAFAPTAVLVERSLVHFHASSIQGTDLTLPWQQAATGLTTLDANVVLKGCVIAGGRILEPLSLAPAVVTTRSVVVVAGGTSLVGAGHVAVAGNAASLVLGPRTNVYGGVDGSVRVTRAQVPASSAAVSYPPVGTQLWVACDGLAGDLMMQGIELLRQPTPTVFGDAWLDPARMIVLDLGTLQFDGERATPHLVVPIARGTLTGLMLVSQALVLRGQTVTWSVPVPLVLQ